MFTTAQELKFKEILYFCLEELRSVKAAVYLMDPTGEFFLVTSYGFTKKDVVPARLEKGDPMIDWVFKHRKPVFVNHPGDAPDLVNVLAAANTTKLLTAPFYLQSRIVGFLDCRDKAGRQTYVQEDIPVAERIVGRFLSLIEAEEIFPKLVESPVMTTSISRSSGSSVYSGDAPVSTDSLEVIPLRGEAPPPPRLTRRPPHPAGIDRPPAPQERMIPAPPPPPRKTFATPPPLAIPVGLAPTPAPPPTAPAPNPEGAPLQLADVERLQRELADLSAARKRQVPLETSRDGVLSAREVAHYRLLAESFLMIPEIAAVVFSYWTPEGCQVHAGCRRALSADVEAGLLENLRRFLERTFPQLAVGSEIQKNIVLHGDESAPAIDRADVRGIQTSALYGSAEEGEAVLFSLILTDEVAPERRDTLKNLHVLARNSLVETRDVIRYRDAFRGAINRLIEPGLKKYTSLKIHSYTVGRIARRFATSLGLSDREVERITVAAILHDVGMRELDYDRIYSKDRLTPEELRLAKEHPVLSALLVDEVPFPYPVAPLIRHHHERWDGAGYPDGLKGEEIPLGARVIHIIEAYDAMTSRTSYRLPISAKEALSEIVREAGRQFDPELAPKFRDLMSAPADPLRRADLTGTWTLGPGGAPRPVS